MSPEQILDIGREAIWTMVVVGAPGMLAALLVGLSIAVLQALTQVQEAAVAFVPKILGVAATLVIAMPWTLGVLTRFTAELFARIANIGGGP